MNDINYKMAVNLLKSVRVTNPKLNVAVVTDSYSRMTDQFNDVVILDKPNKSYLGLIY